MEQTQQVPRANILGVGVSALTLATTVEIITAWIDNSLGHYVCVTGVHGIMECQRDCSLRDIHNKAGLVTPDGMPLVWLAKRMGYRVVNRVYGPELMLSLCRESVRRGDRHFFFGGADGVPERLVNNLSQRFPGLKIAGCYSPPFNALSAAEDAIVMQTINEAAPDIIWVGISTPKQERWMAEHQAMLAPAVLIGVGAAFDIHAGVKRQAPPWMRSAGLEWLFRLAMEPRRLWRRYLINNPLFLALVTAQALRLRNYEIE